MGVYHSHWAEKGKLYYTFVQNRPFGDEVKRLEQIIFLGLSPYTGFEYLNKEEKIEPIIHYDTITKNNYTIGYKNSKECCLDAIFADTKEELIEYYQQKARRKIAELEKEIEDLGGFLLT